MKFGRPLPVVTATQSARQLAFDAAHVATAEVLAQFIHLYHVTSRQTPFIIHSMSVYLRSIAVSRETDYSFYGDNEFCEV